MTRASIEERIIQISKSKMMLDHLVVKKMGTRGETLLAAGELDDILRFGTEEIFSENNNEGEKQEEQPSDTEEVTWDKSKYGDIPTSGGIYYDDAAVESLLDRSKEEEGGKDNSETQLGDGGRVQNEYLNSFKVASYAVSGTNDVKNSESSEAFWNRLLHEGY